MNNWCIYCKNEIKKGEALTIGKDGKTYHAECYNLLTSYSDEFGTYFTDEFGQDISEDLGY